MGVSEHGPHGGDGGSLNTGADTHRLGQRSKAVVRGALTRGVVVTGAIAVLCKQAQVSLTSRCAHTTHSQPASQPASQPHTHDSVADTPAQQAWRSGRWHAGRRRGRGGSCP